MKKLTKPFSNKIVLGVTSLLALTVCVQGAFILNYSIKNKAIQDTKPHANNTVTNMDTSAISTNIISEESGLTANDSSEISTKLDDTLFANSWSSSFNSFFNDWKFDEWKPFFEMGSFKERSDALMQDALGLMNQTLGGDYNESTSPLSLNVETELEEHDDRYVITLSVPGILQDGWTVKLDSQMLTLQGEREAFTEDADQPKNFVMRSSSTSSFKKSYKLPAKVSSNGLQTEYSDDKLTITVYKEQ